MSLQELQIFFDQSQDLIAIVNPDMRYEIANLEHCRYWGLPREAVVGSEVKKIVGEKAYTAAIHDNLTRCLNGEHIAFEQWIDFPNMGSRFMNVKYNPRHDDSGSVTGVFLIARDITQNKKLEEKIQIERDRYEQVLASTNVGLMLLTPELSIAWHNRQLAKQFPHKQFLNQRCHSIFKGKTCACKDCIVIKTFQTGECQRIETHHADKNRWYTFSTEPIFDENGITFQVLGHVNDITERKRATDTLKAKEAELRSIFKGTKAGLGIVQNRVFQQANDYLFEMLGYQKEELIGHETRKVYATEEEYEYSGRQLYEQLRNETCDNVEVRWIRKDGALLDVLITLTPVDPHNHSAGAAFAVMDITERKRAEEAVRQSEQRFRDIFETVEMIAVQGYDKDRHVMYWNPASEQLYGYTREEALGQLLDDLIIPDHMKEGVRQGISNWMAGGPAIPAGELTLVHKDGSPVPVHSSHVMQKTATGEQFMYCIDVNLTEIKRIHDQLIQARDEAEAANRSKSEFLANMSHEIRTPLNGIQGMLALLLGTDLDELQQEYAQTGVDSAVRLNQLLSDILDLSQVEAGKLLIKNEPFDLTSIIHQVRDLFRLTSKETNIELHCHIHKDVPRIASGDDARLRQVLTNLVGNAFKYTESGEVRLEISRLTPTNPRKERILFTIADTGIGIDPKMLETLFSPFTQGSQGYTRQYQGAGLGLSICKRLVSLMGGNMSVESSPDHGTSVHVALTLGQADNLVESLICAPGPEVGYGFGLNILFAEDDRINGIVGQRLLEKEGANVTVISNGREAITALNTQVFDAVLMDVQMPVLDGKEATEAIRNGEAGENNRDIHICALTAFAMTGDRERFLSIGMDDYISKPIEINDLRDVLVKVARKKFQKER